MRRSREPVLWAMFSSGGMLSALCLPVVAFLLWVAAPLDWIQTVSFASLAALARHPISRLFLLALFTLCAFHWAHRFRFTLYDGLQLYHLNMLIAVVTYGMATVLSLAAALILLMS